MIDNEENSEQSTAVFSRLLRMSERPGVDDLLKYLEGKTDFFNAPASIQYHGSVEQGLIKHSIAVYKKLLIINNSFRLELPHESLVITGLLHDVCKANYYRRSFRNKKNDETGVWEKVNVFEVSDQMPLGHGEKSVIIVQKFLDLTDDETLAIRWHMGSFDDAAQSFSGTRCLSAAMKKASLVTALHMADLAASYFDNI